MMISNEAGFSRVVLSGVVMEGSEMAKQYMQMSEYKKRFCEKLGFIPYEGTLNLRLRNLEKIRFPESKCILIKGFYSRK